MLRNKRILIEPILLETHMVPLSAMGVIMLFQAAY